MSKEAKLAKKEKKAAKKAAKIEKSQAASYAKLVKSIEKKNAKAEKKAAKKGKPFEPIAVPTQEEAFASGSSGSKVKKIILMIVLILLIWYIIYFLVMFHNYVAPTLSAKAPEDDTSSSTPADYDRYENQHEITTTPSYSVAEAKTMLKQILHDNWKLLNYKSDPSNGSINYTSNIVTINNQDCYLFTAGSKTYAVSVTLSAAYVKTGNTYTPITFQGTEHLF